MEQLEDQFPKRIIGEVTIQGRDYAIHEQTETNTLLDIIEFLLEAAEQEKLKKEEDIATLIGLLRTAHKDILTDNKTH